MLPSFSQYFENSEDGGRGGGTNSKMSMIQLNWPDIERLIEKVMILGSKITSFFQNTEKNIGKRKQERG